MENEKSILPTKLFTWINYLQSTKFRKLLHYVIYGFVPLLLLLSIILIPNMRWFAQIGEWAWQLLILVLFIKPIIKILGFKELMWLLSYRRELGILCFYFAFAHSIANIFLFKTYSVQDYLPVNNYLFTGLIAIIILIFLYLTSNNISIRYLKRNWKRLQYSAYLVLPLVAAHQILWRQGESDDTVGIIFLNFAFILLKILEYNKFTISSLLRPKEIKQ